MSAIVWFSCWFIVNLVWSHLAGDTGPEMIGRFIFTFIINLIIYHFLFVE